MANEKGLIWSLSPVGSSDPGGEYFVFPDPMVVTFRLLVQGKIVAESKISRSFIDSSKTARVPVTNQPFIGTLFQPKDNQRHPAILVLGGSEGGLSEDRAGMYAGHGYTTLAIAYFGLPSLPSQLSEIPLEYFMSAIQWLKTLPSVDPSKIFILGTSKGGELALLLAATFPTDVKGVVAYVPSSVSWQSLKYTPPPTSSWALNGVDLPYVPLIYKSGDFSNPPYSLRPIYERSMANGAAVSKAQIPVEKISGPVLLFSGGDDQIWPSSLFSKMVMDSLSAYGFSWSYQHKNYTHSGHMIFVPFQPSVTTHGGPIKVGGTMEQNALATENSWSKTLKFLSAASAEASMRP